MARHKRTGNETSQCEYYLIQKQKADIQKYKGILFFFFFILSDFRMVRVTSFTNT